MKPHSDIRATREYFASKFAERRALKAVALETHPAKFRHGEFPIGIFFGSGSSLAYQVNQWLDPFTTVMDRHAVVVITRKPTAAETFLKAGWPHVVLLRRLADVDSFMQAHDFKTLFYVNNSGSNLGMLAFPDAFHVSLGHGESDKAASSTNQFRAYTYVFVPGAAGTRRFAGQLLDFDWQHRIKEVGRPQIDTEHPKYPLLESDRISVLYAPTWEGDKPTGRYSSLASHGVAMISSLLSSGRYRVVFRPHPLSGTLIPEVKEAADEIADLLRAANKKDPSAHHVLDDSPSFGWQTRQLDACISDISSVAFDWMATGKPLIVTAPASRLTTPSPTGISIALPLLTQDQSAEVADILDKIFAEGMPTSYRDAMEYYFGDTEPGVSRLRFVDAVDAILSEHDDAVAVRAARREAILSTPITERLS